MRLIADEVRGGVREAMRSLRADLASAAREAKRSARTTSASTAYTTGTGATTDVHADSDRAVHEADLVLNEFRQQLRTDLRTQAHRGRVSPSR